MSLQGKNSKDKNFKRWIWWLFELVESHISFKLRVLINGLLAYQKNGKNTIKTKTQLSLVYLLELLASWPCICFCCLASILAFGLMVGLAIDGAMLIASKVAIDLLG